VSVLLRVYAKCLDGEAAGSRAGRTAVGQLVEMDGDVVRVMIFMPVSASTAGPRRLMRASSQVRNALRPAAAA
jgi:hypothetical protein